ncbi:hypothetical protein EV356DRAFT_296826 [Viridothelium virens]|uniref:Uncharacterized protein n=1 Tax=Viridothelium virens TaxID=1048519 RepID=A0A6A6H043_VIRVR|nr:hypothetical protein EV356DRAFT_296826 [Viridothelium virens]
MEKGLYASTPLRPYPPLSTPHPGSLVDSLHSCPRQAAEEQKSTASPRVPRVYPHAGAVKPAKFRLLPTPPAPVIAVWSPFLVSTAFFTFLFPLVFVPAFPHNFSFAYLIHPLSRR